MHIKIRIEGNNKIKEEYPRQSNHNRVKELRKLEKN